MKFDNPFKPPKSVNENNISPQKKFQRELYEQCNAIFLKVDTWELSYYCKYLGIYTLLQYYLTLHLRNISKGTTLSTNINNIIKTSIVIFDGKFLPLISAVYPALLNDILNANREPIGRLQILITLQKNLYPNDPPNSNNNVAKKIYEALITQLKSALASYLVDDGNYNATLIRNGMELLFFELLTNLQEYRSYFKNNSLVDLYTFQKLEKNISKVSYDDSQTKDDVVLAKTINIRGLDEVNYTNDTNWKDKFQEVYNKVNSILQKYNSNSNILYSSISNISSQQYAKWGENQNTFYAVTFSVSLQDDNKKAKIDQDEKENEIIATLTNSNLENQKVFYYSTQNIRIYNEIASYSLDTKIITFKNNIGTLSSSNKNITLILVKSGATLLSNAFPSSLTFTRANRSPFKLKLQKNGSTIYENNFTFTDSLLNTNILQFGTPDKISNALFYNNNKNTIDKKSELKLINNNVIQLTKDGSWIKLSKKPFSFEPTQNLIYQNVTGYGFYVPFILKIAGTKYISFDVPTIDISIFLQKIDCYIVRSNRSLDNNNYNTTKLVLNQSADNNGITTLSSQFNIIADNLDKYYLIDPTAINSNDIIDTNYFLIFHIKSDTTDQFAIKFTSLNLSETNNINSYTFNNIDDFIRNLYQSTNDKYNFSNYLNFSKSVDKLKITSEPRYLGKEYNLIISDVIAGLTFALTTASGNDPFIFSSSGKEKKFYINFISYLKAMFIVLNNYALARLIVPEAFEPEDFFNNDVKVGIGKEEMKGLLSDLLEDSGLTLSEFGENLNSDPRSKFLKETSPKQDFAKELTWKSGSLGSLMNQSTLNTIKSTLSTIKSVLKRIKSLLDAVRAFIEILSALLELAEDLLSVLLETVIGQLEKVINNISSTGIYLLPLWELYKRKITANTISQQIIGTAKEKENAQISITPSKWDKNFDTNNTNQLIDFEETNKLLYDIDNRKVNIAANTENDSTEIDNLIDNLLPFRSTNYEEFIQGIINCLTDEDDVPYAGDFAALKESKGTGALWEIVSQGFTSNTAFKPGAPKWNSGTTVKVMIGALTLPAPETIRGAGIAVATLLLNFFKALRPITKRIGPFESDIQKKDPETYTKINTQYDKIKKANAEIKKLKNFVGSSAEFDFTIDFTAPDKIKSLESDIESSEQK